MNCISRRPYLPQQLHVSRDNALQKPTDIQPTKCLTHQKDILPAIGNTSPCCDDVKALAKTGNPLT